MEKDVVHTSWESSTEGYTAPLTSPALKQQGEKKLCNWKYSLKQKEIVKHTGTNTAGKLKVSGWS